MSFDEPQYTEQERRAGRRYVWEFGIGMALWTLLFVGLPGLWPAEPGTTAAVVLALLPAVPLLWAAVAVVRHVLRLDEMQRALMLRSFAVGFGAAMLAAIMLAMLWGAGIRPPAPTMWVFVAGMLGWSAGLAVAFRGGRR